MKLVKNEKGQYTGSSSFTENPDDIKVLIAENKLSKVDTTDKQEFIIEKIIDLTPLKYKEFCKELLFDKDFIAENIDYMQIDQEGIWHCLLVRTDSENMEGILVQSEGYSYARYASLLSNTQS
jgi:hypothetical protein